MAASPTVQRLRRKIDRRRDHVRGGAGAGVATVLFYGDYLCPYCRRFRLVVNRVRETLGDRAAYAYRQFPNERAHPGAVLLSRAAEAAGLQGRFWEMHDALFDRDPPIKRPQVLEIARSLGLDLRRFERDLDGAQAQARVDEDIADGRANGVTATPTVFIDNVLYEGSWDFHAFLEAVQRPVGARVGRAGRAFASLPASAGLVLLVAAIAALACANGSLSGLYEQVVTARVIVGPQTGGLSMSVADWVSEGLMALFFLLVGLEIRREFTEGSMASWRAAALPVFAALGGAAAPAAIYTAFNHGSTAAGWPIATATNIAFALGILAVLGDRASVGLKAFVAAFAVIDDIISVLILAIFFGGSLQMQWLLAAAAAGGLLALLNRWRVYAVWPYLAAALALWLSLHLAGVDAALTGLALAACLPTRPTPSVTPLLAQAATALTELEGAEREARRRGGDAAALRQDPVWDWAARNLSAASDRLQSPAEAAERTLSPWSNFVVLPLFAFTAAGISFAANFRAPQAGQVFAGVLLGLVIGKPLGIALAAFAAIRARAAAAPDGVSPLAFLGAACLCGFGDTFSLVLADHAFGHDDNGSVAKIAVVAGSVVAATLGTTILVLSPAAGTGSADAPGRRRWRWPAKRRRGATVTDQA
jgi:NhaA family Na+:H+ antiporter